MREVAVRKHGALRLTRGAGCIHDGGHVIGLDTGDGLVKLDVRDIGPEIDYGIQSILLEVEHIAQTIHRLADLFHRHRMSVIAGKGNQRLCVLKNGFRLQSGIGFVDRHAHFSDGGTGEVDDAPLIACGRINRDHCAGACAQCQETLGHIAHTSQHLAGGCRTPLVAIPVLPLGDPLIRSALCTIP